MTISKWDILIYLILVYVDVLDNKMLISAANKRLLWMMKKSKVQVFFIFYRFKFSGNLIFGHLHILLSHKNESKLLVANDRTYIWRLVSPKHKIGISKVILCIVSDMICD